MPMVEIDEAQLRQSQAVIETVNRMMADPKSRRMVLEARKIVEPNVSIPELDAAAPIHNELAALRKQQEDFIKAQEERAAKEADDKRQDKLRADWAANRRRFEAEGYDSEGVKKIEEFMEKNGIVDGDIALAAWERKNPRPNPAPSHSGNSHMFRDFHPEAKKDGMDESIKRLMASRGEDSGALDALISSAVSDVRNQGADRRVA
jgi:hypothetical protein